MLLCVLPTLAMVGLMEKQDLDTDTDTDLLKTVDYTR